MSELQNFTLSINGQILILLFLLLLLGLYGWYVYRFTIPEVSPVKRYTLMGLRIIIFCVVVFLMFEPVANLFFNKEVRPVNIVAFDNSASIRSGKDSIQKTESVRKMISDFTNEAAKYNFNFVEFSGEAYALEGDSLSLIDFSGKSTNLSSATGYSPADGIPASLTLITDGIINKGANPLSAAENSPYPIFTISVGDTAAKKDVTIKNILHNEVVYTGSKSPITVYLLSNGFSGESAEIRLYEDDKQIEIKKITLSDAAINTVTFDYTPNSPGEKKLTASAEVLSGDEQPANNKSIVYIKVLDDKINILLLAGYPSADLKFIRSAISTDTSLTVTSLTQISAGKFLEGEFNKELLNKADVLYLINFPGTETPAALLEEIRLQVTLKGKPFFLQITPYSDLQKFRTMIPYLPVELVRSGEGIREIFPELNTEYRLHPVIRSAAEINPASVNSLSPVLQPGWVLKAKPGATVLLTSRVNNVKLPDPMMVLQSLGSRRNIFISGADLWKWKMQRNPLFSFDRFIQGTIKWLASLEEKKLLEIKPTQKIFSEYENIEFTAELVDESFEPLTSENISLRIQQGSFNRELIMTEAGNGLYEGIFENIPAGEYRFFGSVKRDGKVFAADSGRINIGEIDIEQLNLRTDAPLLAALAVYTGGKYYDSNNYEEIFKEYAKLIASRTQMTEEVKEYRIWSNQYILILLILLLSVEWFIRKRSGML